MAKGININWKQPIAYFFVSGSCTEYDIIFLTVQKLFNIGLNVKSFITDMGSNFVSFSNNVNVTPDRPFFQVGENKIIYIFDPPHLLKAARNMFFQHNFKFNNSLIEKKTFNMLL